MTELDVEPGIVLAKVQGSRYTPYRVRIRAKVFSEYQWRRAEKAIAARALTLAKLLAGEMPHDIEEVLAGCKLTLLPGSYDELRATCTCPGRRQPVQAPRGRLLHPRRALRRGPVRAVHAGAA